jgi:CRP/FNR family transcriptional regulator, cyclic AMP receptor protein
MFCNLAPEALADFNAIGNPTSVPKGGILFREGDPGDRVSILCDGKVKLSCSSRDGKTLNLRIALAGDVLGLSAVISGSPFEVTAECLEPVSLKTIGKSEFLPFLNQHGEASMHAARALSEEYKAAYTDARRLALSGSVLSRVAGLLLDWARSASCGKSSMRFNMVLTHDDLASFTGTSRETVSRTLTRLQKDNLIRIHGATVHILMPEELTALACE